MVKINGSSEVSCMNQRVAVFIDIMSVRASIASYMKTYRFSIDWKMIIMEIGRILGNIALVDMFVTVDCIETDNIAVTNFLNYAKDMGFNVFLCSVFKDERIDKNSPDAIARLSSPEYKGLEVTEDETHYIITGRLKHKTSTAQDVAVAIAMNAVSGKYDCVVLGTSDASFYNVIRRYVVGRGVNCGVLYFEPSVNDIPYDFLKLFNYKISFSNRVVFQKGNRDGART